MKKLILITLFSISALIINSAFTDEKENGHDYHFLKYIVNLKGEKVKLTDEKYFVVFKNGRNCMLCFSPLSNYGNELKTRIPTLSLLTITSCKDGNFDRKTVVGDNNKQFQNFTHYFMPTENPYEGPAPFSFQTPEILLINGKKKLHIPYKKIFASVNLDVSDSTKTIIESFYKDK